MNSSQLECARQLISFIVLNDLKITKNSVKINSCRIFLNIMQISSFICINFIRFVFFFLFMKRKSSKKRKKKYKWLTICSTIFPFHISLHLIPHARYGIHTLQHIVFARAINVDFHFSFFNFVFVFSFFWSNGIMIITIAFSRLQLIIKSARTCGKKIILASKQSQQAVTTKKCKHYKILSTLL